MAKVTRSKTRSASTANPLLQVQLDMRLRRAMAPLADEFGGVTVATTAALLALCRMPRDKQIEAFREVATFRIDESEPVERPVASSRRTG